MAAAKFKQFCLLVWKNFVIQKRKKLCTLFEILVPLGLTILLVLIRLPLDKIVVSDPTIWDSNFDLVNGFNDSFDDKYGFLEQRKASIAYAPRLKATDSIMTLVAERFGLKLQGKLPVIRMIL